MKNYISLSFVSILAIVTPSSAIVIPIDRQDVTVFYDVTSQDNYKFITQQLYPTYKGCGGQGNPLMGIEYIPCGENVTTTRGQDGSLHFYCGPDNKKDCQGVMMHSCSLKYLPRDLIPVFIDLSAKKLYQGKSSLVSAREAFEELHLGLAGEALVRLITRCMESNEGQNLVETNENEAIKRLGQEAVQNVQKGTPCVMFNGQYDPVESRQCEQNFMQSLCTKLGIPDLAVCTRVMEESRAESQVKRRSIVSVTETSSNRFTIPVLGDSVGPSYLSVNCGECMQGYERRYVSSGNDGINHCGRCVPNVPSSRPPGNCWADGKCQFGCSSGGGCVDFNVPPRRYCPGCYCSQCACNRCRVQELHQYGSRSNGGQYEYNYRNPYLG